MAFYLSGGHQETLNAAAEVLRAGGNAFDAAIAAYATSFVTEPAMSSAGGGGFAICAKNGQRVEALDFFCSTPDVKPPEAQINIQPVEINFGDEIETYYVDMGSIAIPGAVRGIFALHRRYGSMPIRELFHHAIQLGKCGVELNDFQHLDLNLLKSIFERSHYAKSVFFDDTEIKSIGEYIKIPELADFLELLAIEGEDLFYRGEVGQLLCNDALANGGVIDRASLEGYKATFTAPIASTFNKHRIYTMPNPSAGGALLVWLMNEQNGIDPKITFRSAEFMDTMSDILVRGRYLQNNPIELHRQMGLEMKAGDQRHGSTSHFNILDKDHNAISLTMTIGEGSGYFIPGTGIHMNNMLGEPGLLPDGINSWQPGTHLHSMMTPTIMTDEENLPVVLLGSGGSSRIPFMLAQVLQNFVADDCNLQQAIERPRIFFDDHQLQVENSKGIADSKAIACNHWSEDSLFFGGVHAIARDKKSGNFIAFGDKRRDGVEMNGDDS